MNVIRKDLSIQKYTQDRNQNVHRSINSKMERREKAPNPATQSNKVWKKNNLRSGVVRSKSSKWREFRSLHRHQTKQWGIIFQIKIELCLPLFPSQQQKRSSTVWGITHCTPNIPNTRDQSSIAMEQRRKRWSTLSPPCLHYKKSQIKKIWVVKGQESIDSLKRHTV